jgi:CDP-diglyceride synthetase
MFDLEIRKPDKETVVGFIVAWVCVLLVMLLTMYIAQIGA